MDDYERQVFGVNSYENLAKEIYKKDMRHYHNSAANPEFPQSPHESETQKLQIHIVGNLITKQYIICCDLATRLYRYKKRVFKKPIIIGLIQMDWIPYRYRLHWELPEVYMGQTHVAVSIDNHEIGDEKEFIKWVNKRYRMRYSKGFYTQGLRNLMGFFDMHCNRSFIFMHIRIDNEYCGPLIFMLYNDICPSTCRNFLRLCRNKKYGLEGTPIHRIVPDCWFQGGGFVLPRNKSLLMENYIISHHRRGVLSMACCCHGISNSTQFIVTLGDQTWMNQRYVAFGQLIFGNSILKKIEAIPEKYDAPEKHVLILKVSIYKEDPEYEGLHKEVLNYLKGHVEDVIEFANLLIDEIFMAFEIDIENKHLLAEGENEMEGEDIWSTLTPKPRSFHTLASSSHYVSHQILPSPISSANEEIRPKKDFYHPFSNVYSEDDGFQTIYFKMPQRSERPSKTVYNQSYRKRAEKIMSEWLAGSTTHRVIRGRRERDTPLQKLFKKKITRDRSRAPTIKDTHYRKKSTNQSYFTISCELHFTNSDDSSFERIEKRKHVLNDAAFSKMAMIYDKSSVHRRVSYNYFAAQVDKMDFSKELIKLTSLRVVEYASKRPCMSVKKYIEMNRARKEAEQKAEEAALAGQEELEGEREPRTKSMLLKEGCE